MRFPGPWTRRSHGAARVHPYLAGCGGADVQCGGHPGPHWTRPGRGPLPARHRLLLEQPGTGRECTLIELEALEALARELDLHVEPGLARRNLVTEGIALNHLVGREFTVGSVRLRGMRLCEPCKGLAAATGLPALLPGLIHRGGLRCEILSDGEMRVGDPIAPA
ncbi:MAG: MOSC domain-containing protein [Holophagaceae bacterium]|nr:MOSC domain-containing protein [Holophagaceae bacterium]